MQLPLPTLKKTTVHKSPRTDFSFLLRFPCFQSFIFTVQNPPHTLLPPCWIFTRPSSSKCTERNTPSSTRREGVTSMSSGVDSHEKILRSPQRCVTMAWLYCGALILHQTGQARLAQNSAPSPSSPFCVLLHALSRRQAITEGFGLAAKEVKIIVGGGGG